MKIRYLDNLIGNTPLVEIVCRYNGKIKNIFAKLEWYNLSGSIKDRVALHILKRAIRNKSLQKGMSIVEVTSGNTGISFACLGAYLGYDVKILMPKNMSEERKKLLQSFGAELILLKNNEGFLDGIADANDFEDAFLPKQFENHLNVNAHYLTTAKEFCRTLLAEGKRVDNFVAGVGTGGTLMGCAKRFRQTFGNINIVAVEPAALSLLKTDKNACGNNKDFGKGCLNKTKKFVAHKIQGIGDEFVPPIYNSNLVDAICDITDEQAIYFAKLLAQELGLGVGISSGANFAACLKQQGDSATVFCDDNKKYLSTDLLKPINFRPNFDLQFLELKTL